MEIQIHVHKVGGDGSVTELLGRTIIGRVDATNGAGQPLDTDDYGKMTNWRSTQKTPWKLLLSQPPNAPARGIGLTLRAEVQTIPGDDHVTMTCTFLVNGVEDLLNAQAGPGRGITCMYRTGF